MKKRKYSQWTFSFGALGAAIGIIIGQIGDFSVFAVLGGLSAALLVFVINLIYVRKKSDETPELDERIINNMRTFYFYASNVFFALVFIVLGILLFIDITSISTELIFFVLFGYFVISGIIALIISRK